MPIPAPLAAPLLAVLLAGILALATPALLRWLPVPPDEPDVAPFAELGTPRFQVATFACSALAGWVVFLCLPPAHWPAWVGLVTLGALLGLIDAATGFLPLRLTYAAAVVAAAGAAVTAWLVADVTVLAWALGAGAATTAFFWLVWRVSTGLGFGDVRLAALIGITAGTGGPTLALWSLLLGTLVGAVWGVIARWVRGSDGAFPYGPALLLGPPLALVVSRLVLPG